MNNNRGTSKILLSYIPSPFIFLLKKDIIRQKNVEGNKDLSEILDLAEFTQPHIDEKFKLFEELFDKWKIDSLNEESIRDRYSTLEFLENFISEVTKLSSKWKPEWIAKKGRTAGYIKLGILSKVFMKKSENYFSTLLNSLKGNQGTFNRDFKLDLELLQHIEDELDTYFGKEAQTIFEKIKLYRDTNVLREYSMQQYHYHNPNLNVHYFDIVDTIEKAYWCGFLQADGHLRRVDTKRYEISIHLSIKDKIILERFVKAIGIDPIKIKPKPKKLNGKTYDMVVLSFHCKPMLLALEKILYRTTKSKYLMNSLPKFEDAIGGPSARDLLIGFLRGYYDGDGTTGTRYIGAASKQFLVRIRHKFNIKFPVIRSYKSFTYYDSEGKFHSRRSFYLLNLGALLFNEMNLIFRLSNTPTLKRKDSSPSIREQALDVLKSKLEITGLDKNSVQNLAFQYPLFKLVKVIDEKFNKLGLKSPQNIVLGKYSTSVLILSQLINEWGINIPQRGYWRLVDKNKYLG